ncbi:ABC transporter permease [Parvularcula oceani]|uniref:ABC transporter permease n=1 Tax=Parvularcula oceani TaxID=1247963 RepID=UPI000B08FB20|nr:ABC transporter permease [Parvularcula oceani]
MADGNMVEALSIAPEAPGPRPLQILLKLRTFIALIAVIVFFSLVAPNFLSVSNFVIMMKHISIIAILALGMTFVILTGGIDLSVGSIAGLSGMVAGFLLLNGIPIVPFGTVLVPSVPEVILLSLACGGLIGFLNGILVARFNVAPFIATLGMLYIARGAALLISGGTTFPNLVGHPDLGNQGFPILGSGTILGIPLPVLILVGVTLLGMFVTQRTTFGRRVYALGGNERAAYLSGLRTGRLKIAVYVISGVCAALVGLIIASDLSAAHPASGETLELSAIAAVVLGGASLSGGRGTIIGTLTGACVIGVLGDGMVMMGISEFWQMVIKGAVIVLAVMLDQFQASLGKEV